MDRILKNYPTFLAFQSCGKGPNSIYENCRSGRLSLVKHYFQIKRRCSNIALQNATENGNVHLVKYLLGKGQWYGSTMIDHPATHGNLDLVKCIYQHELGKLTEQMEECVRFNHVQAFRHFYHGGIHVLSVGISAATKNEHWDVVDYLCRMGMEYSSKKWGIK